MGGYSWICGGCDLSALDLFSVDLPNAWLPGIDGFRADFTGANLSGSNLNRAHLTMAHFEGAGTAQKEGAPFRLAQMTRSFLQPLFLPAGLGQLQFDAAQRIIEAAEAHDVIDPAQQRGDLNITPWLTWFLDCLGRAFDRADETLASVLYKARLWDKASRQPLNERQRLVIGRMLGDWEGCMTTSKYARLARCSGDTALRDMRELIAGGVFVQNPGGGRSTSYRLASGEELGAA